ncbi:MAG: 1-phosphofructokinase family hexose kinase, partial [Oscillospiraceae bacterium]
KLDRLRDGDIVVLAGSIPGSLPADTYQTIQRRLAGRRIDTVVDATGELLLGALAHRPFLIKPNNHELGELFGKTLRTPEEIAAHAKKLQEKGARNVLVSMAGDGALLAAEDGQILYSLPPKGRVVNSTGAGESMVAGFLAGYLETRDFRQAFRMGLAAGAQAPFRTPGNQRGSSAVAANAKHV